MPVFLSLECYVSVDTGDNKAKQLAARSLAFAELPNDQSTTQQSVAISKIKQMWSGNHIDGQQTKPLQSIRNLQIKNWPINES